MGQQVATRFGQDAPARIATSATMLTEASAYIPGEPYIPTLIPFYSPVALPVLDPGYTIVDGHKVWTSFPTRTDINFYQGDDVVIPVWLSNSEVDMTDAASWNWACQIRDYHSWQAPLIHELDCVAEFLPADVQDPTSIDTIYVEATLTRAENTVSGLYSWELYSITPADAEFPEGFLRTWLYGLCEIVRRGSTTDYLPGDGTVLLDPPAVPAVWTGSFVVGPNGRVP